MPQWDQILPVVQAALRAVFDQYEQRIACPEQRVRELEERLGRNSTNSSRPQTTDGILVRPKERIRGSFPGGQGHPTRPDVLPAAVATTVESDGVSRAEAAGARALAPARSEGASAVQPSHKRALVRFGTAAGLGSAGALIGAAVGYGPLLAFLAGWKPRNLHSGYYEPGLGVLLLLVLPGICAFLGAGVGVACSLPKGYRVRFLVGVIGGALAGCVIDWLLWDAPILHRTDGRSLLVQQYWPDADYWPVPIAFGSLAGAAWCIVRAGQKRPTAP